MGSLLQAKSIVTVLFVMAATAALVTCAGIQPLPDEDNNTFPTAAPESATPTITNTCLNGGLLLLAFRLNGEARFSSSELSSPGQESGTPAPKIKSPIRIMTSLQAEDWPETEHCSSLPEIMNTNYWNELLHRTLASLTPTDCHCGVVVDILRHHELFVYYDDQGILNSVPIEHKPDSVRTVDSFDCNELLDRMSQVLRKLLAASGNPDRPVVIETGDISAWGYPFIYADGSNGTVRLLQYQQSAPGDFASSGIVATTRTLSHTVSGQISAIIEHPVSSLARLFTLLSTTVADVFHPTPLLVLQGTPIPPLNDGPGMNLQEWEQQLDRITGATSSRGRLTYHVDGKEFFPRLVERVNQAQKSVSLRLYIFDNDDYAIWFAGLIKQRSESIDIRVIIDGLGTIGASAASSDSLPEEHSPPMSISNYLQDNSNVQVHMLANPWFTGDHTKSIIIDEEIAFIGGMNIGREYRYEWHDLMIEVEGPVVNDILNDFESAWTSESFLGGIRSFFRKDKPGKHTDNDEHYPVRVLYTKPGKSHILHAQVGAIRRSRHEILVENAYLTSDTIIYELAKARRRGVDVRVIIPYKIDSGVINRSNIITANALLNNGIRVYIYPGMSHVKAAIYDSWGCFGSANFDNLSFRINKELNLATSDTDAVNALKQQVFLPDLEQSVELTEPLPNNWLDHLAELLADTM